MNREHTKRTSMPPWLIAFCLAGGVLVLAIVFFQFRTEQERTKQAAQSAQAIMQATRHNEQQFDTMNKTVDGITKP